MTLRETYNGRTPESQRHRQTLTISTGLATILAALLVLAGLWPLWSYGLQPMFVEAVARKASEELDAKVLAAVQAQIRPLERQVGAGNAGLKAVILGTIVELENEITELEFRRDYPPPDDWTSQEARRLNAKHRQLATQKRALNAIEAAEVE